MRISWARPALVAAIVVALAGGGTAVALADTSAPPSSSPAAAPATSATKAPAKKKKGHHALARRAEHGEFVVHAKTGDRTVDVQRGVVTAASPTSVTVKSADGFTETYSFASTSKVRKQKAASQPSAIADNDRVGVVATKNAQGLTVTRLRDAGPAPTK